MDCDLIEVIELELKYCERCGGLWIRRRGSKQVYCPSCEPKMAELPSPKLRPTDATLRGNEVEAVQEEYGLLCPGGQA
jgi:Zn-finger nucleic acid-binding protein